VVRYEEQVGVQVRRWQSASSLNWNEEDILSVTHYLNEKFYGYPQTTGSMTLLRGKLQHESPAIQAEAGHATSTASPP